MKKWILVIAAILTLCSSVAMSAENDKGVSIYGLGSQQYGTYLSNRQEIDKNSYKGRASEIYAAYFHGLEWVQHGYYRRTNRYKIFHSVFSIHPSRSTGKYQKVFMYAPRCDWLPIERTKASRN